MNYKTVSTLSHTTISANIANNVQMSRSEAENARGRQCRQAMRSRLCGGISADLTFCYFLVKQKVERKSFPAKVLSEGFQWVQDKIDGVSRPNGYFNWSYLSGQTEPGAPFNINSANIVSYGHPFYMEPTAGVSSTRLGTGFALGADNEWFDITKDITDKQNEAKMKKQMQRALYSSSIMFGLNPSNSLPNSYRNSRFVGFVKHLWFRYAPDPSGGYKIGKFTNLGDKPGMVIPDLTDVFTGGSTMYLHKELAFTSLEQLFVTLGHELVHVSQIAALAGKPASLWGELFINMLDYYAYSYSNSIGGNYHDYLKLDWSQIYLINSYSKTVDYRSFWWTKYYIKYGF